MKIKFKKKKIIILFLSIAAIIGSVGYIAALNGYFGGGASIPEDTMTRGLVASWNFDEGKGDVAYDATTNNNHGNFPHIDSALKFDGTDDYVDCGTDASLTSAQGTIEFWVKFDTSGVYESLMFLNETNYTDHLAIWKYTDKIYLQIEDGDVLKTNLSTDTTITDTNWHQIAITQDGSAVKMYINGAEKSISGTNSNYWTNHLTLIESKIGEDIWVDANNLNGSIDEVRIYSRALTSTEVTEHYEGIYSDNSNLVGHWTLDDGSGDAADNTGTCGGVPANCDGDLDGYTSAEQVAKYGDTNATGWTTLAAPIPSSAPSWEFSSAKGCGGSSGTALRFDGQNDYVDVGDISETGVKTVEFWVKPVAVDVTEEVFDLNGTQFVRITSGTVSGEGFTSPTVYVDGSAGTTVTADWHHIVITTNTGFSASDVDIGRLQASTFFNGVINGVKIYNRALSAEEVRYHYNRGGPVAHWKFDEGEGEKAYDESGNRNHGTLKSSALDFDGTNDYVDCGSDASLEDFTAKTVLFWFKSPAYDGNYRSLFHGGYWNSPYGDVFDLSTTQNRVNIALKNTLGATANEYVTFTPNEFTFIGYTWNGTTVRYYGNGSEVGTADSLSGTLGCSGINNSIGARANPAWFFDGIIDEFRIYDAALSAEEIARHYEGDFSQDPTANLVMLHHFEEGISCTTGACITDDSPGGLNDGTPTSFDNLTQYDTAPDGWITTVKKPEMRWTTGKQASAGKFDGGGDRVYQAYNADFNFGTSSFTISSWFKHNTTVTTTPVTNDYLLSRYNADQGYKVWMDDSGDMCFGIDDDATWDPDDSACTSGIDYDDNQWHHLTAYKDGTTAIYLYIDSVLVASKVSLVATGTLTSDSATLNIGSDSLGSTSPYYIDTWEGEIDDVKIYGYARTPDEIRLDYNAGFAARFGGLVGLSKSDFDNCSSDPAACMDHGLVGAWGFDEGDGDTLYNAADTGSANDGVLGSAAGADTNDPKWTTDTCGVSDTSHGSALQFDGVNDYVNCGSDSSLDITDAITIEAWVKTNSISGHHFIVEKIADDDVSPNWGDLWYFTLVADDIKFWFFDGTSSFEKIVWDVISTNTWYHIVAVFDGTDMIIYLNGADQGSHVSAPSSMATSNADLVIGCQRKLYEWFDGDIDEVRIYNRALSAEEVRYHYNRGGPVGHWKFDEGEGAKAYDESGNRNHGTLKSSALDFDGDNDYVDCGAGASFNFSATNKVSFEMWFKPQSITDGAVHALLGKTGNHRFFQENTLLSFGYVNTSGSSQFFNWANAFTGATWHHAVGIVNDNVISLYVDGQQVGSSHTKTGTIQTGNHHIYIGRYSGNSYPFDGAIDEVRIYDTALSAEEIARHYEGDFSQDPTGNLKMLHHFEEGIGCTTGACITDDSPGGLNDGTPTSFDNLTQYDTAPDGWITTVKKPSLRWTTGKQASAGKFDGGGDRVYQAYNADFNFGTSSFTISSWFKHNTTVTTTPVTNDYLLSRYNADQGYKVWMDDSGDMCFGIDDDATWDPDDSACTSGIDYDDNQWHHLTAYKDGTTAIYLYIDSVLVASKVSLAATGTLTSDSATLNIGSDSLGSTSPYYIDTWEGEIDDVKIYGYARTPDEIRLDYNAGFAARFGSSGKTCSQDPASCMDYGLAGHWNMDEGSGTTAYDASDNSNDGTLTNGPKWTEGKEGGGLHFDGSNDYVNCGSDQSLEFVNGMTWEMWLKTPDMYTGGGDEGIGIFDKKNLSGYGDSVKGYALWQKISAGYFMLYLGDGTNKEYTYWEYTTTLNDYDNTFYHLTITLASDGTSKYYFNGDLKSTMTFSTVDVANLDGGYSLLIGDAVGGGLATNYNDTIDEVRIYNRALSAEEVRYHYNRGGPVSHWKFDEGEGQTAYDETFNNNDGTLGATSAESADDPTWVAGKHNSALSFDGTDYVQRAYDADFNFGTSSFTISSWFKHNTITTSSDYLLSRYDADQGYKVWMDDSGDMCFGIDDDATWDPDDSACTSGIDYDDNQWHHITAYKDGTSAIYLYIDGVLVASDTSIAGLTLTSDSAVLRIGTDAPTAGSYWEGSIDDVRIYNYARSPLEILKDYNAGLAVHLK